MAVAMLMKTAESLHCSCEIPTPNPDLKH